jgi:putative heme-binding domain-containing protein
LHVIFLGLCFAVPLRSPAAVEKAAATPRASGQGKQSFASHCGRCHGLDGRGGEHGPDIATNPAVQGLANAELERVVRDGLPSQGMPSFSALGPKGVQSVVAYLRVLQGKQTKVMVQGDSERGKNLFFGGARCSECHIARGEGGFLGPDLSEYALAHSPDDIRNAILKPEADQSVRGDVITAVTRSGETLTGIARNEDNFSLQLQTPDGAFHLLMKSELASLRREPRSLMPSDYGTKLSKTDLDDLIGFLERASR